MTATRAGGGSASRRPLSEQVVVITGGSSGIGLSAALALGRRGARVVLAARGLRALERAAAEVEAAGGRALAFPADVAEWEQVDALANRAIDAFGRIDTWVNGAAVSSYGPVADVPVEEIRRVMDVGLLGQVHGIKAVLPHMLRQGDGAIIAIASGLGARSVPLQAPYCAAKAGVIALMDSLRVELRHAGSAISATTILPSSIDTPFFDQAGSHLGVRPAPIPPIYRPEAVAEAILSAAEHPVRDITVGGAAKGLSLAQRVSPGATDALLLVGGQSFARQRSADPRPPDPGNLFTPGARNGRRGSYGRFAFRRSHYTRVFEHRPHARRLLSGVAVAVAARALSKSSRP